ncbi:PAS domain S-box-containing protein/diguanylate cyclase (GGDEF) domain-containing protein [Lachnospiraceae bacterium XBB1006]|nr:PAS domain S-box-containing protein/diguanylate cyclase (GGDEF) domain-containing protein [Lachnospiraceae bacterium XBB1006]
MFGLPFTVYYKLERRNVLDALKKAAVPEGVTLTFVAIEDAAEFLLPKRVYAIVVTDDMVVLRSVKREQPYIRVLYDGDWDVDEELLSKVDQCLCEKSEILARRVFENVVRELACVLRSFHDHDMLEALMNSAPDMMWFKRADGIHMDVNKRFSEVVGKSREDCRGATHNYIWNVTDEAAAEGVGCADSEEQVMRTGQTMIFEEFVKIGEEMKQLTTYKAPLRDPFGEVVGTSGIGHDITDFQNMGLELTILLENIPLPIIICDKQYKTIRMNVNFRELTGFMDEDVSRFAFPEWKEKNLTPAGEAKVNTSRHSIRQEMIGKNQHADSYYLVIEQEIRDYFGNVSGYYVLFVDNTVERHYERTILEAANTDELTKLYNRRYFYDYLGRRMGTPMTLLYIDLDHFKKVNDQYGHARGDDVLKKTAEYILQIFPECVAARLGGDEFAVVVDGMIEDAQLEKKCKKLDEKIRCSFRHDDFHISASIGIVKSDGCIKDVDAFIHEGDQRMYEVKKRRHMQRD